LLSDRYKYVDASLTYLLSKNINCSTRTLTKVTNKLYIPSPRVIIGEIRSRLTQEQAKLITLLESVTSNPKDANSLDKTPIYQWLSLI